MSDKISQRAIQLAAKAWCEAETSGIEMDSRLAFAFATILDRELAAMTAERDHWQSMCLVRLGDNMAMSTECAELRKQNAEYEKQIHEMLPFLGA